MAEGKRVWAELAQSYSQAAEVKADAVKQLETLCPDKVDPIAVECVTELADFLTLQAKLLQQSAEDFAEMAALFAMIHAEGDKFEWDSPKGKEYQRREADVTSRMKQTAANEGAAEKRRLAELTIKTKNAATALAKKYSRDFPDLLGN